MASEPSQIAVKPSIVWLAALVDLVLIVVFVLIGRRSHGEAFTPAGMLTTLWPFLVGLAVGWVVTRAWRRPLPVLHPGMIIWACTVVLGMLLRVVSGQGVQWSFIVVATIVTGIFLLGWRAVALLAVNVRRRSVPASRP
jgi:peptidoglycan/LPS O-acetylase OafA/YrhL